LISKGLTPVENIVAVCCSTQGEGTVPVDRDGNALTNCILWMDMRGAKNLKQITDGFPMVAGYEAAKLARWINLTEARLL
jgi:xylulokinase